MFQVGRNSLWFFHASIVRNNCLNISANRRLIPTEAVKSEITYDQNQYSEITNAKSTKNSSDEFGKVERRHARSDLPNIRRKTHTLWTVGSDIPQIPEEKMSDALTEESSPKQEPRQVVVKVRLKLQHLHNVYRQCKTHKSIHSSCSNENQSNSVKCRTAD